MNCQEFAVVAFWDYSQEDDQFKCTRFFIMPNPMKRTIKESEGTKLDQVLYSSPHNKEVFFFFKGYEIRDDLVDMSGQQEDIAPKHKLQIAFLNLVIDESTLTQLGDTRLITNHCKDFTTLDENGILSTFVEYLNETEFADQNQLPNPTVINTPAQKGRAGPSGGMTVVFTAYLRQEFYSKDAEDQGLQADDSNTIEQCWYPTIFFYDLRENKIVWEIFGAEIFVGVDI